MEKQIGQILSELLDPSDFSIAIYSGQFWPKAEQKPPVKMYMLWSKWRQENQEFFTPAQFQLIAQRLRAGKPWVVFDKDVETLIALDNKGATKSCQV